VTGVHAETRTQMTDAKKPYLCHWTTSLGAFLNLGQTSSSTREIWVNLAFNFKIIFLRFQVVQNIEPVKVELAWVITIFYYLKYWFRNWWFGYIKHHVSFLINLREVKHQKNIYIVFYACNIIYLYIHWCNWVVAWCRNTRNPLFYLIALLFYFVNMAMDFLGF
jgi:hypothetical protein